MTASLVLALAWLTTGTATPRTNAPKLTATADVTGDGQPEKLSFEAKGATFQLTVDKAQVQAELPGAQGFTVLDLDASDARSEVLVHGEDQGQARYRLYRWEGAALQEVPLPPGTPSASGNGVLLCDVPMKGWRRRDKYLYDAAKPGFTEVPQELYAVGKQLQAQRELELWRAPDTLELVTRVPGGRAFTLLAFQPAPGAARDSEAGGWFLIEKNGEDLIGMASAQAVAEAQQPPSSQPAAETPRPAPRKLTPAKTELIPAGFSLRVARSFPLQFRRDPASAAIAQLREDSTPRLLATDGVWFLLESESGLLGWATAATLDESLTALEKGKPRDVRASQLLRAQLRLYKELASHAPVTRLPSFAPAGFTASWVSGGNGDSLTWSICVDGSAVLEHGSEEDDEYQETDYGRWEFEDDDLRLSGLRQHLPDWSKLAEALKGESKSYGYDYFPGASCPEPGKKKKKK